jgi:hypothetical protein
MSHDDDATILFQQLLERIDDATVAGIVARWLSTHATHQQLVDVLEHLDRVEALVVQNAIEYAAKAIEREKAADRLVDGPEETIETAEEAGKEPLRRVEDVDLPPAGEV